MKNYQQQLYKKFSKFREKPRWPVYPPYHVGDYLEEYFLKYFEENNVVTKKYFIPIAWSSCYINNNDLPLKELQDTLYSLDNDEEYFIVSTHDDAPREILPKNVNIFSAGGNRGDIPIPLIVNKIPFSNDIYQKKYLASFIGSNTHPIRNKIIDKFGKKNNFYFNIKNWNKNVSSQSLEEFILFTKQSYFGLAPRGYGRTSYRLYEIMQLSSVPVYVSDVFWLPWSNELDWSSFCILCDNVNILDLQLQEFLYLNSYEEKIKEIEKIYNNFFTIDATVKKIINLVNK